MIRFLIGLVILMGAAGGLEQDTMGIPEMLLWSGIGLSLMIWAAKDWGTEDESIV